MDRPLQHVHLVQLHVVPHAADGEDVLAQRDPRLDDVGLRRGVESLELVQLLGEGEGRGGEGVVQDAVLLRHDPRQTLGQRRVRLGRENGVGVSQINNLSNLSMVNFGCLLPLRAVRVSQRYL